ncbi:dTMP kinase [Bacillus cereus]|uniref:dTMP kinase n=1 Tax=Bacillus cereus TaxID=1396 RepID=UPI001E2E7750|nr:hypothetical protein [Bacillus cereus]MCC2458538.1 hypothetical protein [Bacillus cereus]MCU5081707.1 hypothetical protein [Bacillus cereus]
MKSNLISFKHENTGLLISLSGIDGSGKTTLLNKLSNHFIENGLSCLKTKQPTPKYRENSLVKKLQSLGTTDVSYEAIALFSAFDRMCHVSELEKELQNKDVIFTDRYLLDGIVSFVARGLDKVWVETINSFCPEPHISILVDCPGGVAQERIMARGVTMTYDEKSKEILEFKRNLFLEFCSDSTLVIDGTKDCEAVFKEALDHINSQLNKKDM